MRFTVFVAAICLTGSIVATPIETAPQDLKLVTACFTRLSQNLAAIEGAMRVRPNGGSIAEAQRITSELMTLSQVAIEDTRVCARDIRRSQGDIGLMESLNLLPALNTLETQLQKITEQWMQSKSMVAAAGQRQFVMTMLMDSSEAIIAFSETLISKLPYLGQPFGTSYKTTFATILEKAITAYKKP
jgi:hypothetical protein